MKFQFDHLAITVSDLQQSIEFYRDILGFKVLGQLIQDNGNFIIVYLDMGNNKILELFNFSEKGEPITTYNDKNIGIKHFAYKVANVDETYRYLSDKGVEFSMEPTDAEGGVRIAFFKDPDGILIEIIQGELDLKPYENLF
ncbi:MAG TPA: VOC family protein [Defluviitoga sp.]|nr:VOC family protein [Defluviitoga sp.]HOP25279.1 VOC family protein [Defluviitoga sp.]HPZ29490.1 VOC family protein [Defluviitoga sp.]HQD63306.1 VOC family protein [Defluviitoga sp.]